MLKKTLSIFLFSLIAFNSFSQEKDSLLQILTTEQNDTARISTLFELAGTLYLSDPDTAIIICKEILDLSIKCNSEQNIAESYGWLGYLYGNIGKIDSALDYNLKSAKILEKQKPSSSLANTYINIATIYDDKGQIKKTFDYYKKSLIIHKKINSIKGVAIIYNNMAYVYSNMGYIEKSIKLWHLCLNAQKKIGDKKGIATSYSNIGAIYSSQNDNTTALEYYNKSIKIYREINDKAGEANVLKNIGSQYFKKKEYILAEKYFNESLEIFKSINKKSKIAELLLNIGSINEVNNELIDAKDETQKALNIYDTLNEREGIALANIKLSCINYKQQHYSIALKNAKRAYKISKELKYPENIEHSAHQLKDIYLGLKNYKKAFEFYNIEIKMRDSRVNKKNYSELLKQETKYKYQKDIDKKNAEITRINIENNAKKTQIKLSLLALIITLAFSIFIIINRRKLKLHYKKQLALIKEIKEIDGDYKKILDSNSDTVFMISSTGKQLYFNKQVEILLGYKFNELYKKSFTKFVPKSEIPKYFKKLKEVFVQKKISPFETFVLHKEGKKIPVEIKGKIIKYKNKDVGVGTIRDITERKKAEKALIESEQKFKDLFNESGDAVLILENGNILDCNKATLKLFNYKNKADFLNLHPADISPNLQDDKRNSLEKANEMILKAINNKTNRFEWLHKKSNGEIFHAEVLLTLISNKNEKQIIHSVVRDISERKQIEKKILKSQEEAIKANKLKSEFLANMSHEIRTPMNAIIGFSEILKNRVTDKKNLSFIEKILKSGDNLLELINDILDLSKIEAGELKIQKSNSNIYNIVNDISSIFSRTINEKPINFNVKIDNNVPESIIIDPLRVKQILLNLVSNALKFTEKGSVSLNINSTIIKKSNNKLIDLHIQVKDTGIGIPQNQTEAIFQSFRQVEGQSTRKFGGTGLGLAITKRIIDLMGGNISVESEINNGSTFKVTLNNIEIGENNNNILELNDSANINFKKSKILHVEDIEFNREIIQLYFENKNFELKDAETGNKAIEILKNYKPDLILMDIQLPGLNGYETARIIKNTKNLTSIPIIAITANATSEEIAKYKSIFDDYLTKPILENKLFETLKKYLNIDSFNIPIKRNASNFDPSTLKNIILNNDAKKEIVERIEPIYNTIKKVLSIEDVKIFADKNIYFAKKYNIESLNNYSNELLSSIDNFDIEKINTLIDYYNEITKIIYEK